MVKLFLASLFAVLLSAASWLYVPTTATPFDPTQLTGKIGLFIADAANLSLSGSDVLTWNDISGNGNNAAAGILPFKPQFNASGLNGQGTITFAASGNLGFNFTSNNLYQTGRGASVYVVLQHNLVHAENIFFTGTLGAGADFPVLEYHTVQGGGVYLFTGNPATITAPASWPASPGSAWHIVDYTYNGGGYGTASNSSLRLDRTPIVTSAAVTYADYGSTNNVIANYDPGGNTAFAFTGDMATVIILDHALTGTERTNLNNWVLSKYGI